MYVRVLVYVCIHMCVCKCMYLHMYVYIYMGRGVCVCIYTLYQNRSYIISWYWYHDIKTLTHESHEWSHEFDVFFPKAVENRSGSIHSSRGHPWSAVWGGSMRAGHCSLYLHRAFSSSLSLENMKRSPPSTGTKTTKIGLLFAWSCSFRSLAHHASLGATEEIQEQYCWLEYVGICHPIASSGLQSQWCSHEMVWCS